MPRIAFVLLIGFSIASFAHAQLKLIPTPQRIEMRSGSFLLKQGMTIGVVTKTPEAAFAAQQLIDEVQRDLKLQLKIGDATSADIKIDNYHRPTTQPTLPDSYALSITSKGIELHGWEWNDAGVFYGVQTLKQIVRANAQDGSLPNCEIDDSATLRYRVWQDDISRGPIPTMDFLKREVRTLSELKYNAMTLYTEHVFKLKSHPDIAPDDGITADQIKELSEYAKQYHVEVIGNFQSFGHMAHILSLPAYKNLGDNGWNISPAKEASYKFLADCYSEVAPAYESKLFDINCDEVTLGKEGASKEMVAKFGLAEVYARHINRIADLLRPYGKRPMMWGDIAVQHPDIVPKLPKDLIVLSWGYSARESFDEAIEPFTKIGLRFMVCPGVSCWNRIFPDYKTAQVNIANYVRDGAKQGAIGMINTSWDDDGENLFNQTWYPFAWGAECAWNPISNETREKRQQDFDAAFGPVFYGSPDDEIVKQLWRLDELRSNPVSGNLEDRRFWRDGLTDPMPLVKIDDALKLRRDAESIQSELLKAKQSAHLNADTLDAAIFAASRVAFMADSSMLLMSIETNARAGRMLDDGSLKSLHKSADDLLLLRRQYEQLWRQESRPWWLDHILEKYDHQLELIKGTPLRVLFSPGDVAFEHSTDVTLIPITGGGDIYYTTDGSEPTADSMLYKSPIHLDKTTTIRAKHFVHGESAPSADSMMYRTFVLPAKIDTNLQTFQDFGLVRAFDGERESYFWGNHAGGDIRAGDYFTIELAEPRSVSNIAILTGHRDHPDDILQHGVLEISVDGKTFEKVADSQKTGWSEASFDSPRQIKCVRLRATADQHGWLIIREMTLE